MGKPSPASRFFYGLIGVIGELLITAAILLGLFAFWQAFWTTFEVQGVKAAAINEFANAHKPASQTGVEEDGEPPVFDKTYAAGEVYGILHVPRWDWDRMPLAESVETFVLDQSFAGHYETTAQAGNIGNFSVAAHRRSYGNSFLRIEELQDGDPVVVELDDYYVTYEVNKREIFSAYDPDNIQVIAPVPGDLTFTQEPTERWMTMTTCHPAWGNSERYIVHLKYKSWTKKSSGIPPALVGETPVEDAGEGA